MVRYVAEEIGYVRTTLTSMPDAGSQLLFDASLNIPAAQTYTSFLQIKGRKRRRGSRTEISGPIAPVVQDLNMMAKKFPQDASAIANANQQLARQLAIASLPPQSPRKLFRKPTIHRMASVVLQAVPSRTSTLS
jgi:hypothetical protein